MWSISDRIDEEGNHVGINLYDFDKTALYVYNSDDKSISLPRGEMTLQGKDATGILSGISQMMKMQLCTDPTRYVWLDEYIKKENGR